MDYYHPRCNECGAEGPVHPFLHRCDSCVRALWERSKQSAREQVEQWEQEERGEEWERQAFKYTQFDWIRNMMRHAAPETTQGVFSQETMRHLRERRRAQDEEWEQGREQVGKESNETADPEDARPKSDEELLAPFSAAEVARLRFLKHLVGLGLLGDGGDLEDSLEEGRA